MTPYDSTQTRKKLCTGHHHGQHQQQQFGGVDTTRSHIVADAAESKDPQGPICSSLMEQPAKPATLDTRALAEASRNLTQKLKQLSSEVLTSRVDLAEVYIITGASSPPFFVYLYLVCN